MRFLLLFIVFVPVMLAETPAEMGTRIEFGRNDADWQPLFHQLALAQPIRATFSEKRMFPFRKQPTQLEGEMRVDPARGLSLHYLQPEEHILVADSSGLLQRDAQGHSRPLPANSQVATVSAVLLPVLNFDVTAIARLFDVFGLREGSEWRLELVAHDPAAAKALGHLVVVGDGRDVRRLEFVRSANQFIEISLGPIERLNAFDAETVRRYFR